MFLKAFAVQWHGRFMNHASEWDNTLQKVYGTPDRFKGNEVRMYFYHVDEEGRSDISTLKEKDKLAVGVDFHCYPKIIDTLLSIDSLAEFTREEVEKAIWYHRSGVYEKKFICDREHAELPQLGQQAQLDLQDTKVTAGQQRTLEVWERVKNFLEELVATGSYWRGRLTPPPKEEKKKERGMKKRKREEEKKRDEEHQKNSAEIMRRFLEGKKSEGGDGKETPNKKKKIQKKVSGPRSIASYFPAKKKEEEATVEEKEEKGEEGDCIIIDDLPT